MNKAALLLAGLAVGALSLTACGSSYSSCEKVTPVSGDSPPSDVSGAAGIIASDPAGSGAVFSNFYAVNDTDSTGDMLAAYVTLPGQSAPAVGVWFVGGGTLLFAAVNGQAQAATQGMMANTVTPDNAAVAVAIGCVNGTVK